jgi:hypothetical protein
VHEVKSEVTGLVTSLREYKDLFLSDKRLKKPEEEFRMDNPETQPTLGTRH